MKLLLLLSILLSSCYTSLRTGYYQVEAVRGYTVELKGVQGMWSMPTDTLKIGDTIFIKRVFRERDANMW